MNPIQSLCVYTYTYEIRGKPSLRLYHCHYDLQPNLCQPELMSVASCFFLGSYGGSIPFALKARDLTLGILREEEWKNRLFALASVSPKYAFGLGLGALRP